MLTALSPSGTRALHLGFRCNPLPPFNTQMELLDEKGITFFVDTLVGAREFHPEMAECKVLDEQFVHSLQENRARALAVHRKIRAAQRATSERGGKRLKAQQEKMRGILQSKGLDPSMIAKILETLA